MIREKRLATILSRTGHTSERRRCSPADSVIWLVIAMALFAVDSNLKVWRRQHLTRDRPELTDSTSSQARRRLGVAPLRHLFEQPIRRGKPSMVGLLLDHLGPGDLPIWDRGFFGYELIRSVVRRDAHLLARAKSNTILRPIRRPADGS